MRRIDLVYACLALVLSVALAAASPKGEKKHSSDKPLGHLPPISIDDHKCLGKYYQPPDKKCPELYVCREDMHWSFTDVRPGKTTYESPRNSCSKGCINTQGDHINFLAGYGPPDDEDCSFGEDCRHIWHDPCDVCLCKMHKKSDGISDTRRVGLCRQVLKEHGVYGCQTLKLPARF